MTKKHSVMPSKTSKQSFAKENIIPDNTKSVSADNNSAMSSFWACIYSVILTIGIIGCYTSAFNIKASLIVCTVTTLIFVSVVGLISSLVKHKSKFFISLSVILIAFIFTVLFSLKFIVEQFNYFLNCILKSYSAYLAVPRPLNESELSQHNATVFLVVIAFITSFIFTTLLVRTRRFLPVLIITVVLLIPCFVLVNTLPALPAIVSVVAILFSLYITTFLRRRNIYANGIVSPLISLVMVIATIAVCVFNPVDTYERGKWQDMLLYELEILTGVEGNSREFDDYSKKRKYQKIGNSFDKTKLLSEVGPLIQSNKKAMKIFTDKGGTVYLRGISYGDYNLNQWSLFNEDTIAEMPDDLNPFTHNNILNDETQNLSIITEKIEPVIYTTYYNDEVPDNTTLLGDVCISNDDKETIYNFDYHYDDEYFESYYDSFNQAYSSYVYDNYLYLPDETREAILQLAEDKNFTLVDDYYSNSYIDNYTIAQRVKNYVSEIGYYSLDTEKMPEGKDFPIWFLTEAESGYCVHYATTATVMLRAFGVPARYVTGYIANAKSGEWTTVTEKNAHAWVEYFDYNKGWVMLEATPSSFTIPDNDTIDSTIATKPTTQNPTSPSTKPSNSQNNKKYKIKISADMLLWLIPIAIVLLILSIPLRRKIITDKRNKSFKQGRNNTKAICLYRYIQQISAHSTNIVPELIDEIALKAKFSNHKIENSEVEILKKYADESRDELYSNSGIFKKLYFKFIEVI